MTLKQAKELVRSRLSDQRYEHTLNVKKMAVKLAEATGADCVQVIGSKFVLYLQKKKDSAYADLLK